MRKLGLSQIGKSERGFGVIALMVVAAILALSLTAMLSMYNSMYQNGASIRATNGLDGTVQILQQTFAFAPVCQKALAGGEPYNSASASSTSGMEFNVNLPDQSVIGAGQILAQQGIKINSLRLINATPAGTDPVGNSLYEAQVILSASKLTESFGGQGFVDRPVGNLVVTVSPANVMVNCSSLPACAANDLLVSSGTNPPTYSCQTLAQLTGCGTGLVPVLGGPAPNTSGFSCETMAQLIGASCAKGTVPESTGSGMTCFTP